jgi:hypothetical protein
MRGVEAVRQRPAESELDTRDGLQDLSRGSPHGLRKHHYMVLRWFVPHGDVVPDQWMREVHALPRPSASSSP